MPAYSTVQAGSTVIGSATGDSLIVATGDADQFGIGASVIVWPSGQPLEAATSYDTMDVIEKTGNVLTVLRNEDHASATIAEGDQVGLMFPQTPFADHHQVQVLTFGRDIGYGPTIDLGKGTLGILSEITAVISDVNLDGGTPGTFEIDLTLVGSFNGVDWGDSSAQVTTASGVYLTPRMYAMFSFRSGSDPTPLYGNGFGSRYIRFQHEWFSPSDVGPAASATVTLDISYY